MSTTDADVDADDAVASLATGGFTIVAEAGETAALTIRGSQNSGHNHFWWWCRHDLW